MTAALDTTFQTFFETKTAADVEGTMAFFSPDLVSYIDAGITALELDAEGLITRITSVYDSRRLGPERKGALLGAAFAP